MDSARVCLVRIGSVRLSSARFGSVRSWECVGGGGNRCRFYTPDRARGGKAGSCRAGAARGCSCTDSKVTAAARAQNETSNSVPVLETSEMVVLLGLSGAWRNRPRPIPPQTARPRSRALSQTTPYLVSCPEKDCIRSKYTDPL